MDPLTWYAIGMLVTSLAISVAMANKAEKPKAATLEDMNIPQVDEGTAQTVFFGDCWTGDWMVLWTGNLRTTKIKSNGGKKSITHYVKKALKVVVIANFAMSYPLVKQMINR